MYEELVKCADLMIQFGGHPMAAGLSIEEKNIDKFKLNLKKFIKRKIQKRITLKL